MSIMDLFRGKPADSQTVQNANTQQSANTDANGTVPAGANNAPATGNADKTTDNANASPLDAFKDLWQTPAKSETETNQPMFAGVDPAKLMESAKKVDFAKIISPEQLTAINAGGAEATKAFAEAMNSVAQSVYAQSAFATTKIVEQALESAQKGYDAKLQTAVKRFSVAEKVSDDNPLLSNPAFAPIVSALQDQLIRKNPNASAKEIQSQVNDYVAALGSSFAPKTKDSSDSKRQKNKSEDWSAWLEQ